MLSKIKYCIINFLYNEDRAIASLGGAPPQETLSSEIGRHQENPIVNVVQDVLDKVSKEHTQKAITHANALDKADDGMEQ